MYDFNTIEKKWQKFWEDNDYGKAVDDYSMPKKYNLIEFPYPSGIGMHLGHIKAYLGMEVKSRMQRMQGFNVLFPIGFDAFGLPAENYAIEVGRHPRDITAENIAFFTEQLKRVGYSFDYSRAVDTTDPKYYKWTQWIFCKLFEHGLAFRDRTYVNYCPKCKVVLSNEDSQGGKCDRCDTDVIQKEKDVWFLRITEYADKLLSGLETVDYPQNVLLSQVNWIGKSEGAYVNFKVNEVDEYLRVYTTRPDTLFGATFMVIAPEHPLIDEYKNIINNMDAIEEYREMCIKKTEFERTQLIKDKTGVKIDGLKCVNPLNNKEIPIFIADYVMMGYGTGAIMAVPAHDTRDYEFAIKFNIPIIEVIRGGDISKEAYCGDGIHINSEFLDDLNKENAISRVIEYLCEKNIGEAATQYKMKDWAFNRQRYWGEPIPIVHCETCGMVAIPYEQLPLELPKVDKFEPGRDGESPLASIEEFVNCKCPKCGKKAKRETDTMPQWAGSSWYYLRYCDPHNEEELCSKEKMDYWMNVDTYNGGAEHITRHMIYSRFWHHFLYDIGIVNTPEPYKCRTTQGLVLGSDGSKMSKSKGNGVNPDDVIESYGADVLRCYVLFMGDYAEESPWNEQGVRGVNRFLDRVSRLSEIVNESNELTTKFEVQINKAIKKIGEDIDNLKYNTAIAELMKLINTFYEEKSISKEDLRIFLTLLNPFAPHLSEEMNEVLGMKPIIYGTWPVYDEAKVIDDTVVVAISVNGKLRATVEVEKDIDKDELLKLAKVQENIVKYIEGNEIIKEIVVPNKIVNIVVK